MTWQLWTVVVILVINVLLAIAQGAKNISKADPLKALIVAVLNAMMVGLIFWSAA